MTSIINIDNIEKNNKVTIGIFNIHLYSTNLKAKHYLPNDFSLFRNNSSEINSYKVINYEINLDSSYDEPSKVPLSSFNEGPIPYKIYRLDTSDYLWIRVNKRNVTHLVFQISSDWNNWRLIYDNSINFGIDSFNELAYIFPYSILNKGGILFHGVVMEWRGIGILVCAHSGVGKTTHTRMWKEHENALIINGDRALCCMDNNKWYTYGCPWNGSSGECLNRKAELKAIVILEQAPINQVATLTPIEGALELIPLAFAPDWEETLMNHAIDTIDDIVQNIPVLKLRCTPDLEAVTTLKNKLEEICLLV
jgi:hypothetical protein